MKTKMFPLVFASAAMLCGCGVDVGEAESGNTDPDDDQVVETIEAISTSNQWGKLYGSGTNPYLGPNRDMYLNWWLTSPH